MKLFDKYFQPYAEYCIRTTFSEEELKEVFEKELLSYNTFRFAGCDPTKVCFFKTKNPLVIHPVLYTRNSLRGVISIKCKKTGSASETILHITIAPVNQSLFIWTILCFSIGMSILFLCAGVWQAIFPLFMPVFVFTIIAISRSIAENELPEIRQAFENTLRQLEEKYCGDDHAEKKN
ncbi:MAG: hypothetical protein E7050_09700 [Lentisphaerae bacterium]|nr:hypothetical protein [Lentisphaerota bacterium]